MWKRQDGRITQWNSRLCPVRVHKRADARPFRNQFYRYLACGANAICELLALKKPNLLIPLSANASRGDQILNANSFKEHGYSMVLTEEDMNKDTLLAAVRKLYADRHQYIINMEKVSSRILLTKL